LATTVGDALQPGPREAGHSASPPVSPTGVGVQARFLRLNPEPPKEAIMSLQTQTPTNPGRAPVQSGDVHEIALNKLKASPRNARRVGHTADDVEARAASIRVKGLLQPLVVEPEVKEGGQESGYYLVTIGEGRRQALKLLAKRKLIGKAELVRCVVDTRNDPAEISLDENVSRRDMHPADQFEAFKDLAERKGYGAEEIGARFGVSPQIVRQRLRLGSVAPALLDLYREDALTLEQMMAFAVAWSREYGA
jgi:ParB family chromosome partitioning protein